MRVTIEALSVSWPGRSVLREVSGDFAGPGRVALMGPSGAGKSTLLAVLAGHLAPTSGSVIVAPAERPEWIVQASPMLLGRSALENAAVGSLSRGADPLEALAAARHALETLGLAAVLHSRAHRLSGGERQRVAVARALAARPGLVLADEPTASLDAGSRDAVIDALGSLRDAGALVLIATHDPHVAASCERVLTLDNGRLVEVA
jgi:ABC-type lipoprotein export system ATPase subunit